MYAFSELRHAGDLAFKGLGDLGSERFVIKPVFMSFLLSLPLTLHDFGAWGCPRILCTPCEL